MSGTSGTLIDFPPIADSFLAKATDLLPSINPLVDFVKNNAQGVFALLKLFTKPPPIRDTEQRPVVEEKPFQAITQIHSSSSSSVSISGKLPQPLESSGGSSSSYHTSNPSETFGSSIAFHNKYGPPQVGRSGHLFASRSSPDVDEINTRFSEDELDSDEKK